MESEETTNVDFYIAARQTEATLTEFLSKFSSTIDSLR